MDSGFRMQEKLFKAQSKRQMVRIERAALLDKYDHGFVLAVSPELVLIRNAVDFTIDGYSVIRISDITSYRSGRYERFIEKIYREEGWMGEIGESPSVDITNLRSLLHSLMGSGKNIIVECERPGDDAFYIGKPVGVTKAGVSMRCFDALGQWDSSSQQIVYDQITKVRFEEKYINIYTKYLKS
jgi:hypothetical protein